MTTFAADHDTSRQLEQLDERMRTAWEAYRTSTSQLEGPDSPGWPSGLLGAPPTCPRGARRRARDGWSGAASGARRRRCGVEESRRVAEPGPPRAPKPAARSPPIDGQSAKVRAMPDSHARSARHAAVLAALAAGCGSGGADYAATRTVPRSRLDLDRRRGESWIAGLAGSASAPAPSCLSIANERSRSRDGHAARRPGGGRSCVADDASSGPIHPQGAARTSSAPARAGARARSASPTDSSSRRGSSSAPAAPRSARARPAATRGARPLVRVQSSLPQRPMDAGARTASTSATSSTRPIARRRVLLARSSSISSDAQLAALAERFEPGTASRSRACSTSDRRPKLRSATATRCCSSSSATSARSN